MKPETAPRFAGIGGHHSHAAGTVEWLTPPEIIGALGPFDLDPCASVDQPWPTATRMLTVHENGLLAKWGGRTWLNPPYANGVIERWLARMAEHDHGTALIFARTETDAFFRYVWERATALLFMRGRINFHVGRAYIDKAGYHWEIGDRAPGNAGAPTVLCAYGMHDADVLAGCSIDGEFVPLKIPRSVVVAAFALATADAPWRELIAQWFADKTRPVLLAELYDAFSSHPKAVRNRHFEAKIRQQLQRGPYERVDRALWSKAE